MPQKMHQSRQQLMPQQPKKQQLQQPQMQQHIDDVSHHSDIKPEICQRHHPRRQLENSGSIHISSQKKLQDSSPQITQHAPHEDTHSKLSCNPIFIVPSVRGNPPLLDPSLAPSDISRGSQKFDVIPLQTDAENVGQQTARATPKAEALNDAAPGVSVSPLPAELTSSDMSQANISASLPSIPITREDPMERLIKSVKTMSSDALNAAVADINYVVSLSNNVAISASGKKSRSAVGEDLAAMRKCRLQAKLTPDGSTNKMKRAISVRCRNDRDELDSAETSYLKRQKIEAKHALLDEISDINRQLIDTIVSIAEEEDDSIDVVNGNAVGTIVKFCFTAISLSPSFRSEFTSGLLVSKSQKEAYSPTSHVQFDRFSFMFMPSPIKPLRLLVPADYPTSSPIVLDKLQLERSKSPEDLSHKVKRIFDGSIDSCVQPMPLKEMAKAWDTTVYKVIRDYAEQSGGGSFSSICGAWESAPGTNFLPSWGRTGFYSLKVQQAR